MSDGSWYDEILKASNNLDDIRFPRYALVTDKSNDFYEVQEYDSELVHSNVASLVNVEEGDYVLLVFVGNDLHSPCIVGKLVTTI